MTYNDKVRRYFYSDQGIGEWPVGTADVYGAQTGSMTQGALLQLQVCCKQGVIKSAKFKAYGEPTLIAAMAYLVAHISNKSLKDVRLMTRTDIIKGLDLAQLKHYCAVQVISLLETVLRTIEQGENDE